MANLILVRASKSRGGKWSDDDFDVRLGAANGKVIGRIFLSPMAPKERPWFWTITERFPQRPTERGYAPTREQAMAAFKLAWEDPIPEPDPEALIEWAKRNIQND